jgi:hypothetical protein
VTTPRIYLRKSIAQSIQEFRRLTGSERDENAILEELVLKGIAEVRAKAGVRDGTPEKRLLAFEKKFETYSLAAIQCLGILKALYGKDETIVLEARATKEHLKNEYEAVENQFDSKK